jgi:uncharacterized protein (TIGR02996 family)
MTERDFLRAIHDDPEDPDTFRVYADWLEDHGEAARGQLIRTEVDLLWSPSRHSQADAMYKQSAELQKRIEKTWSAFKKWKNAFTLRWRNGLPGEAGCGEMPSARRLRALPDFPSVTKLSTSGIPTPEEWELLAERTDLRVLSPSAAPDFDALARLTSLPGFVCPYREMVEEDLDRLRPLQQLRLLDCNDLPLTDAGLARLVSFPLLERLRLYHSPITDAGLEHLAGLRHLKELDLSSTPITDAGLQRLSHLRELTVLILDETQITAASLDVLVGFTKLRRLVLNSVPSINDTNVTRLTELPELIDLELRRTHVTRYNLRNLAGQFPKLKRVRMETNLGPGDQEEREIAAFLVDMEAARLLVEIDYE